MKKILTSSPKNFTSILYQNGPDGKCVIGRLRTRSQAKFTRNLKLINSQINVYLKVSYIGGGWNDGYYTNTDDLMVAYKAFVEK